MEKKLISVTDKDYIDQVTQYPALSLENEIKKLISPLKYFNITYFSFVKVENGNEMSAFCSDSIYAKNYLKKKYFAIDPFADSTLNKKNIIHASNIIWDLIPCSEPYKNLLKDSEQHNIAHAFSMTEVFEDACYTFYFATEAKHGIDFNNTYIQNLDKFQLFNNYIKNFIKSSKEFTDALSYKIKLPTCRKNIEDHLFLSLYDKALFFENNIKQNIKKLFLDKTNSNTHLTKKELACIHLLRKGFTAKEIAKHLSISPRTIEEHIAHIKQKLNCANLMQLGEKIGAYKDILDILS